MNRASVPWFLEPVVRKNIAYEYEFRYSDGANTEELTQIKMENKIIKGGGLSSPCSD
jgi:hypothetical protein